MWKSLIGTAVLLLAAPASRAAELSATELRWLQGVWPVLVYAKGAGIPLDVTVQPQPTPGAAPLALGYVDGRCKLVLSMRGNPEAQATLERIEPDLLDATLELIAAHELGHCRRYLDGSWLALPAGFSASVPSGLSPELRAAYLSMKAVRLEEGYADLVGLAWTQAQHREAYPRVYAWLVAERSRDLMPGSHHDTLAWLHTVRDGSALGGASLFVSAGTLWGQALPKPTQPEAD